jgi:hypothetical protein
MWRHYVCSGHCHTHFPAAWAGGIGQCWVYLSLMFMLPPSIKLTDHALSRTYFKPCCYSGFYQTECDNEIDSQSDDKTTKLSIIKKGHVLGDKHFHFDAL